MKKFVILIIISVFAGVIFAYATRTDQGQNSSNNSFDKKAHSTSQPSSIWIVVNKNNALPSTYVPDNLVAAGNSELLRKDTVQSLKELLKSADSSKASLRVLSGFRSYAAQDALHNAYVAKDGQAKADTYSARAGHSEHQTGLAVDLGNPDGKCDLDICFGDTAGGRWLAKNAYKYGFIVRYTQNNREITGYQPEPWHMRYVGKNLARQLNKTGLSMEEFFNLPVAAGY